MNYIQWNIKNYDNQCECGHRHAKRYHKLKNKNDIAVYVNNTCGFCRCVKFNKETPLNIPMSKEELSVVMKGLDLVAFNTDGKISRGAKNLAKDLLVRLSNRVGTDND